MLMSDTIIVCLSISTDNRPPKYLLNFKKIIMRYTYNSHQKLKIKEKE